MAGGGGMHVVPKNVVVGTATRILARAGEVRESKPGTVAENADPICPGIDAINGGRQTLGRESISKRSEVGIQLNPIVGGVLVQSGDADRVAGISRDVAKWHDVGHH